MQSVILLPICSQWPVGPGWPLGLFWDKKVYHYPCMFTLSCMITADQQLQLYKQIFLFWSLWPWEAGGGDTSILSWVSDAVKDMVINHNKCGIGCRNQRVLVYSRVPFIEKTRDWHSATLGCGRVFWYPVYNRDMLLDRVWFLASWSCTRFTYFYDSLP